MAPFVGNHSFQREVVPSGISLKRLSKYDQQILSCRGTNAVLGAARSAVNVPILYSSNESQPPGNPSDAP